jgi:aromatic ring-cleaving dioxygenase
VEKCGRIGQATDDSMCVAYWIPKTTNPHPQNMFYLCFSTATIVARTCFSVMVHTDLSILLIGNSLT